MIDIKNHISAHPDVMLGKPIIKGTRITVEIILRKMADGYTPEEIIEMYPHLSIEDIQASITYAALVIGNEEIIKAA